MSSNFQILALCLFVRLASQQDYSKSDASKFRGMMVRPRSEIDGSMACSHSFDEEQALSCIGFLSEATLLVRLFS
jgi:hypothetical protein